MQPRDKDASPSPASITITDSSAYQLNSAAVISGIFRVVAVTRDVASPYVHRELEMCSPFSGRWLAHRWAEPKTPLASANEIAS